jgi:hypothetical protein
VPSRIGASADEVFSKIRRNWGCEGHHALFTYGWTLATAARSRAKVGGKTLGWTVKLVERPRKKRTSMSDPEEMCNACEIGDFGDGKIKRVRVYIVEPFEVPE